MIFLIYGQSSLYVCAFVAFGKFQVCSLKILKCNQYCYLQFLLLNWLSRSISTVPHFTSFRYKVASFVLECACLYQNDINQGKDINMSVCDHHLFYKNQPQLAIIWRECEHVYFPANNNVTINECVSSCLEYIQLYLSLQCYLPFVKKCKTNYILSIIFLC